LRRLLRCPPSRSALAFSPHQSGLVLAVACQQRQLLDAAAPGAAAGGGSSQVLLFEGAGGIAARLAWTLTSRIEVRPGGRGKGAPGVSARS
jgi:hypothetical protein